MFELILFGSIEVRIGGVPLSTLSKKSGLLLAYLTIHNGRPASTSTIADALFPDSQAEDTHDLIKKAAWEIRKLLGDEAWRLSSPAPRKLALNLEGANVDWMTFQQSIKKGDPESLEHAVALHAHPLLDSELLYWAMYERMRCLRERQKALEALFDLKLATGDLDMAGVRLTQMLKFELPEIAIPEEPWQAFLSALLVRREYGRVQLFYTYLKDFLHRTQGRDPQPDTQALYHKIPRSILQQISHLRNRRKKRNLPPSARLPQFPFSLLGREDDLKKLPGMFSDSRLVTIQGVGGVGKTRFAAHAGHELFTHQEDEASFIDLTACARDGAVPAIANTLGVKPSGDIPLLQSLCEFVAERRLLLILDNCEQVVQELAEILPGLLHACPHLRLLLTSREPIRVAGERILALQPLALPAATKNGPNAIARVEKSPAVRLFVERAAAVTPGFRLTESNAETIAGLCRLVDGLPLGIEIVASQTAGIPLERIAADFSTSALNLMSTRRDISARHRSLHAALDWSYGMLLPAEKALLRRLSVFSGGWTLEAAENVCSDSAVPRSDVQGLLASLVARSLVVMNVSDAHQLPYRFLETIRTYAAELLEESGELEVMNEAHCRYYHQMIADREDLSRIKTYLADIDLSRANIYAAIQRSLSRINLIAVGQQMCISLHNYWSHRLLRSEGREWHRKLVEAGSDSLPKAALAGSMLKFSDYSADQNLTDGEDGKLSAIYRQQALEIYRELGDRKGEADVHFSMGMRLAYTGPPEEANAHLQKALDYYQESNHPYLSAFLLIMIAGMEKEKLRFEEAVSMQQEALKLSRAGNLRSMEALSLMAIGELERDRGDLRAAEQYFTQSTAAYTDVDSSWGAVRALSQLADVKRLQGDNLQARDILCDSIIRSRETQSGRDTLFLLALCARLLHATRNYESSLILNSGLLLLSERYPNEIEMDEHRQEFQTAIQDAGNHLGKDETDGILRIAGTPDLEALLDFTLAILRGVEMPVQ